MPNPPGASKNSGMSSLLRDAGAKAKQQAEAAIQATIVMPGDGPTVPNVPRIFSIIDYIEAPWGLGMTLYPAQRFLVKLYYYLPLDDKERRIHVPDMFNTRTLYTFTEKEYLKFLYEEGRCNIGEQDHERRDLLLAIGRRAGKTTLSGVFASYEVYRLLNLHNPQAFYGLPNGNRIQIISVATDKDQAGLLFNEVTTHLAKCEYFKPFIANNTLTHIQFRTPYDIEKYGPTARHQDGKFVSFNGKATLRVTFKSCIAKGLRGSGNAVVILDEMAHFKDNGQSSAKDIYDAVTPSTAAFSPKDPKDTTKPIGPVESRVICISSPLSKSGKFYELFHLAMSKSQGAENLLAIQAPTWEVNPTLPSSYYRRKYHEDPAVFMTEHGAQFSDRVRGWIERESDLLACVSPTLRPREQGVPRFPHQMGIDIGLIGDGSAVAITHVEGNNKIVLDYHEIWYAGVDWRESNPHLGQNYPTEYARTLAGVERLDFDELAKWIQALCKRFYISDGLFDRWTGIPLEQSLTKVGLRQFRSEFFTRVDTSKMYQAVKMLIFDEKVSLYDWPIAEGTKHSPLIAELLDLQAEQMSKNVVLVAAPPTQGHHDDLSDALIRAIYLSSEKMVNNKVLLGSSPTGVTPAGHGPSLANYQLVRARKHGGFTERTPPRHLGMRMRGRMR